MTWSGEETQVNVQVLPLHQIGADPCPQQGMAWNGDETPLASCFKPSIPVYAMAYNHVDSSPQWDSEESTCWGSETQYWLSEDSSQSPTSFELQGFVCVGPFVMIDGSTTCRTPVRL